MPRAVFALICCVVLAGCLGGPGAVTPPGTGDAPSPTAANPPPTGGEVAVEYVIRAGAIPASVRHVYVDLAVYLAERPDDVYPCTSDAPLLNNRYDPTPTPLRTPAGRCAAFDLSRIDLAGPNGSRTVERVAVNRRIAGAHTLVVHDVTIVLENGSTASRVHDTDFRALTERSAPTGSYGVEISVMDYRGTDRDLSWRFGIEATRYDPADE